MAASWSDCGAISREKISPFSQEPSAHDYSDEFSLFPTPTSTFDHTTGPSLTWSAIHNHSSTLPSPTRSLEQLPSFSQGHPGHWQRENTQTFNEAFNAPLTMVESQAMPPVLLNPGNPDKATKAQKNGQPRTRTSTSPEEIKKATTHRNKRRKRGRPSLNCEEANGRMRRIPHTEVERRYRESLNAKFNRLRCAIPTLPQVNENTANREKLNISKGIVLASAIDYIKKIETERDAAHQKLAVLKGLRARQS